MMTTTTTTTQIVVPADHQTTMEASLTPATMMVTPHTIPTHVTIMVIVLAVMGVVEMMVDLTDTETVVLGGEAEVMDDMTAEDMEIVTMEDAVMTPATTVVDMAAAVVDIDVEDPEEAIMALEEEAEAADPEVDLPALLASFQALLKTSFEDRNGTCLPSRT